MSDENVTVKNLADAIYRDRVLRARQVPFEDRIPLALEQYDFAIGLMKAGLQQAFPDADESRIQELMWERMRKLYRLADHGRYQPLDGTCNETGQ